MKIEHLLGSRKRLLVLGALATLALAPVVGVVSMGSGDALSNNTPAKSLFALLSARSPGERTTAQLADTKPARGSKTVTLTPPRQRALPKVQPAKPSDEFANLLLGMPTDALVPALAVLPPITTLDLTPERGGTPSTGGTIPSGCCGGGGGGDGGDGGGGGDDDDPPPGNVPAVPEPATWAMLMLGVFGCGSMLRRRPRGGLAASR